MRNPTRPIPSPFVHTPKTREYWDRQYPHPTERKVAPDEAPQYDPTRLLPDQGDLLGIDRRGRSRSPQSIPTVPQRYGDPVLSAAHVEFDRGALLGLHCGSGWVVVHALALSSRGVLVRLFDLSDPLLPTSERTRALAAYRTLNGVEDEDASPLAVIGRHLIARRLMADLSIRAHVQGSQRTSQVPPHSAQTRAVTLRIVSAASRMARPDCPDGADLEVGAQLRGEVAPMTDPKPDLLAIVLEAAAHKTLEYALQDHATPSAPAPAHHPQTDAPPPGDPEKAAVG